MVRGVIGKFCSTLVSHFSHHQLPCPLVGLHVDVHEVWVEVEGVVVEVDGGGGEGQAQVEAKGLVAKHLRDEDTPVQVTALGLP